MSKERVCRITGLTSAKGQKLNGSAANVSLTDVQAGDRLPVYIDGQPGGPLALKRSNIHMLPNKASTYEVGVGRGSLRDSTFNATVVDPRAATRIVAQLRVSDGADRSRGNLQAIEELLKFRKKKRLKGSLLITPTDLNVARAVNRIAAGGSDVTMDGSLNRTLQSVAKLLRRETEGENMVVVKFSPHRVQPDGLEERLGPGRFGAALNGRFKIYPCPYEKFLDAMEVRYVDATSDEKLVVKQEIYLDYGVEEAELYVRHAVALGEKERLSPSALAEVDPQAFWSALLHIEAFVDELEKCNLQELVMEWSDVRKGVEKSWERWKNALSVSVVKLPPDAAAGIGTNWGIQTEKDHKKVSNDCARATVMMMLNCVNETVGAAGNTGADDGERDVKPVTFETFDWYKGTELDRLVSAMSRAAELERAHIARGKKLKEKHHDLYLNQALEEAGFGSDALDLNSDPLRHCGHCGRVDTKLKNCARCNGAAYCNTDCQIAEWRVHSKECSPIIAQGRRIMRECSRNGKVNAKTGLYKPRSKLPTKPCMVAETSGIGAVNITWIPGQESIVSFTDFSNGVPSLEGLDRAESSHIRFKNLSDLLPSMRFLLTCGPLPDISIARSSLNDTLRMLGGDVTRLRVKIAGFTALEWAAKKGNAETVEWLCTDDRTKAVVGVGCPVGWACYTGQVEIARTLVSYGADPAATDMVLWNCTPPLLVAAQNGQLEAMKYLVEELGQDIHMRDPSGRDVLESIKTAPNYKQQKGHKSAYKWAKEKMS